MAVADPCRCPPPGALPEGVPWPKGWPHPACPVHWGSAQDDRLRGILALLIRISSVEDARKARCLALLDEVIPPDAVELQRRADIAEYVRRHGDG